MTELKAKDILQTLPRRKVVGHRTELRVGGRAWLPPRFAKGRKIFERLGMPDPWDPNASRDAEVGLGEVGLPTHREPKPHLMPKETAKPGGPPKLPNIPGMPPPMPREASGRPAPRIGETRKDDTEILRAKSKEKERLAAEELRKARMEQANSSSSNNAPPLVKLPVRPDLEGALAAKGKAPATTAAARPPGSPAAAPPRPVAAPVAAPAPRPQAAAAPPPRPASPRPGPRAPTSRVNLESVRRPLDTQEAVEVVETPASDWRKADVADLFGTGGGGWEVRRFGAAEELEQPSAAEPGEPVQIPPVSEEIPVVVPAAPPARMPEPAPPEMPVRAADPVERNPEISSRNPEIGGRNPEIGAPRPRPAAPPPNRKPPGNGGLDDLFGMGGAETRVRIPKPAEGEQKPRRPMVSTPDQMAEQKIDRRPPPPKPPSIKPTGGGGMADPEAGD